VLACLVPQEEMGLDTVVSGSAGKRRRSDVTTGMAGIAKGAQWCGYARHERGVGVTWELVGQEMRQVAVKWNTTGEWRALE
jgi:hypothetical protein